jgi:hypothetical protein
MKTPTIILEVRGGNVQMIGSTTKDVNIIVVDYDNYEGDDPNEALNDIRENLSPYNPDYIKANHKLLVEAMFSECHDEIDQAIHDRLIQIEEEIEA